MANEFYAISTSLVVLNALTETNLSVEPHPNEFHEAWETVGTSGEGLPIEMGSPWAVWTWPDAPLEALEWKNLFDLSGIGTAASAEVYIRTRTNQVDADGTYEYLNYKCIMHRPTGNSVPYYRFSGVQIRFERLVLEP